MRLRTVGKVLLYGLCGNLWDLILLLMLSVKLTLDRVPAVSERNQSVGACQDRLPHRLRARRAPAFRWYGPELYFERLELRSKDDQRVLARAAGRAHRRRPLAADPQQARCSRRRIELDSAQHSNRADSGPNRFALASEIELGGSDIDACPGSRSPICRPVRWQFDAAS